MSRNTVAHINLDAMRHNLGVVRQSVPGCPVLAVVKSNAYGFGVSHVLPALSTADGYAVAFIEEALALASYLPDRRKPIVVLQGVFCREALSSAIEQQCTLVVHSEQQLQCMEAHRERRQHLSVWLKVNTGMNRLGFAPAAAARAWQRLSQLSYVKRLGLMTHFACADEPEKTHTQAQLACFKRCQASLQPPPDNVSVANSAAILNFSDSVSGWLRPGIMLYGGSPSVSKEAAVDESFQREESEHTTDSVLDASRIEPVMTLLSQVIALQNVKAGESIGYGAAYVAPHDCTIAVIGIGYGDGYPRHMGAQQVYIRGTYCPLVGRVSMDMLTVDVSRCPGVLVGDTVELWGKHVDVNRVASAVGTISYELFCQLTHRVKREAV